MQDSQPLQCPGCGATVTTKLENCEYCGSRISWPKEETKVQEIIKPVPIVIEQPRVEYKRTSGAAVASLVLALFGIAPLAIIFGIVGISAISKPENNASGRGIAVAGIIISSIQILVWIIIWVSISCTAASVGYNAY
jgi:hypothetical protein